jgi:hypothetical protein
VRRIRAAASSRGWRAPAFGLRGPDWHTDTVARIDRALRLNPLFGNGPCLDIRTNVQAIGGQYEDAIRSHEAAVCQQGPIGPPIRTFTASTMTALARPDDAHRKTAELRTRFAGSRLTGRNFPARIRDQDARARLGELMVEAEVPW